MTDPQMNDPRINDTQKADPKMTAPSMTDPGTTDNWLFKTIRYLIDDDKGIIAMDESTATCNKRFAELDIPQTEEARRDYRDMIISTPCLSNSISGAILYDETIRQKNSRGVPFAEALIAEGILPGIKVDRGAIAMPTHPTEKLTEGLDGLRQRLQEYSAMGARFAKWRAMFTIGPQTPSGPGTPSVGCIEANASALARYAALCQEIGLVPIVEAEVLMDGDHGIEACARVTETVLRRVFDHLYMQSVDLKAIVLKPNMVLPGQDSTESPTIEEVAEATVNCLLNSVPASVTVVAFLSGGQSGELASARLSAMNRVFHGRLPWALSFSFSRAIQNPAMRIWAGKLENTEAAQHALAHRAACDRAARHGTYGTIVEKEL